MKSLIFFTSIVAASAQFRQFRQSVVPAEVSVVEPEAEEPSKFGSLIPEWDKNMAFNYTDFQDNLSEKFGNIGFAGNGTFTAGAVFAPVTNLISSTGSYIASAAYAVYSAAVALVYPTIVIFVLFVGVYYLVLMALQVTTTLLS